MRVCNRYYTAFTQSAYKYFTFTHLSTTLEIRSGKGLKSNLLYNVAQQRKETFSIGAL